MGDAIIPALLGSLYLIIGVCFIISAIRSIKLCVGTTSGRVVDVEKFTAVRSGTTDENLKRIVIKYTVKGKVFKKTCSYSTHSKLKQGNSLTVFFEPKNPKHVIIKGYNYYEKFFYGGLFIFMGLVCMIVARIVYMYNLK